MDFLIIILKIDELNDNFELFKIFYEKMAYSLSIDTAKMDIVSLMAYIGGILGLFLGISVFSVFEIFIFLIEVYFIQK